MGMGGNGNSPHGNPMGMGISQKIGNGDGREWELNRWEWEGIGMLKAIPAHLYNASVYCVLTLACCQSAYRENQDTPKFLLLLLQLLLA